MGDLRVNKIVPGESQIVSDAPTSPGIQILKTGANTPAIRVPGVSVRKAREK
jgi:hypothetical protein